MRLFSPNWKLKTEWSKLWVLSFRKTCFHTNCNLQMQECRLKSSIILYVLQRSCLHVDGWTEIGCNSKTKESTPKSSDRVTKDACRSLMPLCRMQWDDKFAAKRRVILDSYFLEHLTRDADVTQINSASPLSQCKGEAEREGPLGLNCQALSASWGV